MAENDFVLNWGIVATGLIAQDFCSALKCSKSKYNNLKAVSDIVLGDAKRFAERYNIPSYYDNYEIMFQQEDINVVYVASVNTSHKVICIKALNAGKHVLCEKPMSINSRDQEEIFESAKRNNRFFMEGVWVRFLPIYERLKLELQNNTIGDVKFFSGSCMILNKDKERIRSKEKAGGGILDLAAYPIQLASLIYNHEQPLKITCTGHLMSTGVDECCTIVLLYSNQRIAQINISTNTVLFGPSFIIGEKGVLQIPEKSSCPTDLILPDGQLVRIPMPECEPTNYINRAGLIFEIEAVRDAISKGLKEHPFVTHDHSRLIMRIIEESKNQLGYIS